MNWLSGKKPEMKWQEAAQPEAQAYASQYIKAVNQLLGVYPSAAAVQKVESKELKQKELEQEEMICATGGLVGHRAWYVAPFRDEIQSFNGCVWPAKKKLLAVCTETICLGERCSCGIYAYKNSTAQIISNTCSVIGEVWLWGNVVEHELGYRAQFGYPKAFRDTGILAKRMAVIYGVNVIS